MNIQQRIQLSSVSVLASGLLALVAVAPDSALANPCAPKTICYGSLGTCGSPAYQMTVCNFFASPGCTATSVTCQPLICPEAAFACRYD